MNSSCPWLKRPDPRVEPGHGCPRAPAFSLRALHAILVGMLLDMGTTTIAHAEADVRREAVAFDKRQPRTLRGHVQGRESIDYIVAGKAGQMLTVALQTRHPSVFFNVLPPGSEAAIFIGSISGDRCETPLRQDGDFRIRVYLMRNAARRGQRADYALSVSLTESSVPAVTSYDRRLDQQGIHFHVTATQQGSVDRLRVEVTGLAVDNRPVERVMEGRVAGAETADLDADGSPELYVYVKSRDSAAYGSLMGFAANQRKSLSDIHLPPPDHHLSASSGYRGQDEFAVLEGALGRRFPIYAVGDNAATKAQRIRQIQYKLRQGEAGWSLKVDKVIEY